jgi:hypothetical protein
MGITRISKRIQDKSFKISLGLHADEMVLSDQASYGMWGLYSSAMRETGLIRGDERTLMSLGDEISRLIEAKIDKKSLLALVEKGGRLDRKKLGIHAKPFCRAIQSKPIQSRLIEALMGGSETNLVQHELWSLTREMRAGNRLDPEVPAYIHSIKASTKNEELKGRLIEIENIERLLVAANNLFHYCRRKDGEALTAILAALASEGYNYAHLSDIRSFENIPHSNLLGSLRDSLVSGNNRQAIYQILELNKVVMERRGGAPWVELEKGDKLRVRVQSETSELCSQPELRRHWDYEYFFTSYLSIANQAPVS